MYTKDIPQNHSLFSALVAHNEANEDSDKREGFELRQVFLRFCNLLLACNRKMEAILISVILAIRIQ